MDPTGHRPPTAFLAAILCAFLMACEDDSECDPGQEYTFGHCLPAAADDDDAATRPPPPDAAAAEDTGAEACEPGPAGDARGFGAACNDAENHSDCTCEADYCALMPGAEEGSCTVTGCIEDQSLCPEGWSCLDLSVFGDLPSVCVAP